MKLERFFQKFGQLTDAPDAVAKMRELVLELAVQGKLVVQNPRDEDAMHLLAQIREKNPFVNVVDDVGASATKFEHVPASWAISSLGEVSQIIRGVSFPGDAKSDRKKEGNVACLRTASVQDEIDWNDLIYVPERFVSRDNQWVAPSDIIISMANSYALVGKVAIVRKVPQRATFGAFLAAIRPVLIEPYYLLYVLRSPRMQSAFRSSSSQTTNIANISLGKMRPLPFPLPPLAEQRRIVEKVDELMALCDRLEAQQKERTARHIELTRAAIAHFDEAPSPTRLNLLLHPSYSIAPTDLRKVILNLAVSGKLVSQDQRGESVDDLLEHVSEERRTLKRKNPSERARSLSESSLGYEIPHSWRWRSLGEILVFGPTNGFSPKAVEYETAVRSLTLTATTSGRFRGEHCKFVPINVPLNSDLWLRDGDILVQRGNTLEYVGVSAVYRGPPNAYIYPDLMMKLRVSDQLDLSFIHLAMSVNASREFMRSHASGTSGSMPKINQATLTSLPLPIPPLSEQRRIVSRVAQLMSLVDQLEAKLTASEKAARELLDAVIHELLHPTAAVIEFPSSQSDSASERAAVGCYAIKQLLRNPSFGRTMLMKACYLAETHLGLPLGWQPMRQAAGPWDPWVQDFESLGTRGNWFTVTEKALHNGRSKFVYSAGKALKTKAADAVAVLGRQKTEFDRLLDLFADKNTEEAEIITTLFAAWNDFLFDGKTPTDDEIIHEVRDNWHHSKQRFTPALLRQWLDWMRGHDLVPRGRGPRTRQQLTLRLK